MLKPSYHKAYYRCAESLCKLGDVDTALSINSTGRSRCDQVGDLERQYSDLQRLSKYVILFEFSLTFTILYHSRSSAKGSTPASVRELPRKHRSTTASDEIDASTGSTSAEVGSSSRPSKKTKVEPKEKVKDHKSSDKLSGGSKGASHKASSKPLHGGKGLGSPSTVSTGQQNREEPTRFELLQYPVLDSKISCQQLRQLSNLVKVKNFSFASYFSQSGAWENLEPSYVEPPRPRTDPTSSHKPMPAIFDEIWCPIIADVEDSENIIPPTFTYLTSGAVKQTLPTLVSGIVRKEVCWPY